MELLQFQGQSLKKYAVDETYTIEEAEYIIQQVESHDAPRSGILRKQGFDFHERFLFMEINIKATADMRNRIKSEAMGITLELSCDYPEDLYELAYESFETDRRFHLEQEFDQCKAQAVKKAYIDWCKEREMYVFSARRADELLGYIIADTHSDRGSGCFQIMLGVTKAGIKGKMAAFPLYSGLLARMSLPENGGYTKYYGYVSSSNMASINLHCRLGARVIEVVDEYIYRVREG